MYDPFLTEETFFVATKCCLFNNGKILILSENRPGKPVWWELPGGKISKADHTLSPIESLARELREEL
jgi:8-oxo-dGTP pyrophosphatase MutT (NUDIX family)